MADIHDYLRWRGDISFTERPFNDADNLVFAILSYIDFSGIVGGEGEPPVRLADACAKLLEKAKGKIVPYVRSVAKIDLDFLRLVMVSERFGSALASDHVDVFDPNRSMQFSALCFALPTGQTYVSFRGTDSTIIGWREDFMLSFTVTEAQRKAAEYLYRTCGRAAEQGRRLLVGGHSKGGCLAEYAVRACPEWAHMIERVYSNDGPGMAPETLPPAWRARAIPLRKLVPAASIIGMIFESVDRPPLLVKSTGQGIGQHDPTTWKVTPYGLEMARAMTPDAIVVDRSVDKWARGLPLEDRARVVNQVFDALEASRARTFAEIASNPEMLQRVADSLSKTDDTVRNAASDLLETMAMQTVGAALGAATQTASGLRIAVSDAAEGGMRKLRSVVRAYLPQPVTIPLTKEVTKDMTMEAIKADPKERISMPELKMASESDDDSSSSRALTIR